MLFLGMIESFTEDLRNGDIGNTVHHTDNTTTHSNRKLKQAIIPGAYLNIPVPANLTCSDSALSAGACTGIGLACLLAGAGAICALMYWWKKRQDRWAAAHPPPPPAIGMVMCCAHAVSSSQTADQHCAQLQHQPGAPTARPAYVTAPAPGRVTQVFPVAKVLVAERQPLFVLEHGDGRLEQLTANSSGYIHSLSVSPGGQVTAHAWLAAIAKQ